MKRRRPRSGLTYRHAGRDDPSPSLAWEAAPADPYVYDRRVFHPDPGTIFEVTGRPVRYSAPGLRYPPLERVRSIQDRFFSRPVLGTPPVPSRVSYAHPERTPVCARRQERREVLHAHGVAGRRGLRPPRRNETSAYSCKK